MTPSDLLGKHITNILLWYSFAHSHTRDYSDNPAKHGGFALDEAKVLIEIGHTLITDFPPFLEAKIQPYPMEPEREYLAVEVPAKKGFSINRPKAQKQPRYTIVDILFFEEEPFSIIEIENDQYLVENIMAPSGTGQAGLNVFNNLEALTKRFGNDFTRLTSMQS
ncbi:MAG: hypothetical protein AB8F95_15870 [Bacteroidia bacterium]